MKKKTWRKILLGLLLLITLVSLGIIYANRVILPVKIKSLIIQNLEKETGKKVTLESVQFNIFKGLVLRKLDLYDGQRKMIGIKEASCSFLILPIFKESKIVIPAVRIQEPIIFLERKADKTINLIELLPKKRAEEKKPRFSVVVSAVSITGAHIDFQDDSFSPAFTKSIDDLNLNLFLSLPASMKFNLKARIKAAPIITINANGEFQIFNREFRAKISIQDLLPKEFSPYYKDFGWSILEGKIDSLIGLNLKDNSLNVDLTAQNKNIALSKDKMLLKLNSEIKANLQYNLKDRKLKYSGKANVVRADISGIETFTDINNLSGQIQFNDSGLSADKITANVLGFQVEAKINLSDFTPLETTGQQEKRKRSLTGFNQPQIYLEAVSQLNLKDAQRILAEKFKIALPAEISGQGKLSLKLKAKLPAQEPPQINPAPIWCGINGSLDISSGRVKIDRIDSPFNDINGTLEFTLDTLKWSNLSFKYLDTAYAASGSLADFKSPLINLNLSSKELFLKSNFTLKDKLVNVSKLEGKYLNSKFFLKGKADITRHKVIPVDVNAELDLNLKDLATPLVKFKDRIEQIKPAGRVKAKLNLSGNLNDFKACKAFAKLSSSSFSVYGLRADAFLLDYNQSDGLADISLKRLSLYGGMLEAGARINLEAQNLPFWIEAKIDALKIEKLKEDTPLKAQNLAGDLFAITKLNGFLSDYSKLSGSGKILIKDGRLWEINLLKGLGKLLFTRDFTDIIFNEGYCEFFVKDRFVFTENLKLKSALVNLEGNAKIGFDSSLDASINVQMGDELAPGTGSLKDITTALIGQAGRFAVIKLGGTLQKPEYKFKPAVVDVLKGIKDTILGNIFGQ